MNFYKSCSDPMGFYNNYSYIAKEFNCNNVTIPYYQYIYSAVAINYWLGQ